jgi:hypothetical protein
MMFYKLRKKLFWLMLVLFIVAGSVFVVYSFGYRLDMKNWKIVQTGGLNVKTTPKTTEIILDGEKINKKAGLFSNEIFVQGLIPGIHNLEVSKEGYFTWKKSANIEPEMVDSFSNIVLMPENSLKEEIYRATTSEEIVDVLPLGNGGELLLETTIETKSGLYQVLSIFDKGNLSFLDIFSKKISSSDNLGLIKNLIIDGTNYNHFLINYYDRSLGKQVFYLWDKSMPDETTDFSKIISQYFFSQPQKILFHPFEYNKFIVSTSKKLGILDLDKKVVDYLPPTNPSDFNLSGNSLFWIDKVGGLYSYNLIMKSTAPIAILDEKELSVEKMVVSSNSGNILLFLKGGKVVLVKIDGLIHSIGDNVSNVVFSPDNKKIAYVSGNSVQDYFLEDLFQDVTKKAGEIIKALDNDTAISDLIWFKDSFHLLARSGEKVFFVEIDDRDNINTFEQTLKSGHYYWNDAGEVWRTDWSVAEKINLLVGE